jgi:crotonobetainyl-CoA:carnitine CoA-transferase CaiB-like acyl-CoA transferase
MLDGAHFYSLYECADGGWISVGPLEPKFYGELLEQLGVAGDPAFAAQYDRSRWPALKEKFAAIFRTKSRAAWAALLEGTDVCFAAVLAPGEAVEHPHMRARNVLRDVGGVLQAAAAPRFDGAEPPDPGPIPAAGQHTEEILAELGVDDRIIADWRASGAI